MKVPAHVATFETLGANPTPMNFGEVYSALQQGVIDGQENPCNHHLSDFTKCKNIYRQPDMFSQFICRLFQNPSLKAFSAEHQKLVRDLMAAARDHQAQLVAGEDAAQLEQIRAAGVEVLELTAEQRQVFADKTESVRLQYREKVGAEAYDNWFRR